MIWIVLCPELIKELESAFTETTDSKFRGRIQMVLMAHRQRPHQAPGPPQRNPEALAEDLRSCVIQGPVA